MQTTPLPGWKITTASRQLDKPIEMDGEQLTSVVSEVTWTAIGGGIRPGQFQDFNVSLGQLPESGELVFNALQTYSSGEKVIGIRSRPTRAVEPEHPAPILTITPAAAEGSGTTDQGGQAGQDEQVTPPRRATRHRLDSAARCFGCRAGAFPGGRDACVASGPATSPGSGGSVRAQP